VPSLPPARRVWPAGRCRGRVGSHEPVAHAEPAVQVLVDRPRRDEQTAGERRQRRDLTSEREDGQLALRQAGAADALSTGVGVNVAPHSVTPVRVRFFVRKVADAGQRGYGDVPVWSEDSLPDLVLTVTTVRRRRGLFASRSTESLPVTGGLVRRSHRQGVGELEIHYLTKPPPAMSPATSSVRLALARRRRRLLGQRHRRPSSRANAFP
jgi:hypothetical protein